MQDTSLPRGFTFALLSLPRLLHHHKTLQSPSQIRYTAKEHDTVILEGRHFL